MAILGAKFLDLIDLFKRSEDTLQIATIIELLSETNSIMDDALTMECNMGSKHRTTVRTGLPTTTWGQLYQGIAQSRSTTQQVDDATGFLEALSSIDKRLLDISDNQGAVRLSEATAFLEALAQDAAAQVIYGNVATTPERFTGLAPRFNSLSAQTGGQIVDAGGTGSDNTSIWFVSWSPATCHLLFPKGTQAGISRDDKGQQRVLDDNGDPYYVMEEMFTWHLGLTVRDWRQVVRVANIDSSLLAAGSVDIYKFLRKGFWKLKKHRVTDGRIAVYANADVLEALDADSTPTTSTSASFVRLRPIEVDGFEVMGYRGMPLRQVDAILNNEAQIT